MADPFYFDDEREPEDDGRPQLPRKPRYCDDEQPAGPRLTFAHERARATDGIYVSPPAAPEPPAPSSSHKSMLGLPSPSHVSP